MRRSRAGGEMTGARAIVVVCGLVLAAALAFGAWWATTPRPSSPVELRVTWRSGVVRSARSFRVHYVGPAPGPRAPGPDLWTTVHATLDGPGSVVVTLPRESPRGLTDYSLFEVLIGDTSVVFRPHEAPDAAPGGVVTVPIALDQLSPVDTHAIGGAVREVHLVLDDRPLAAITLEPPTELPLVPSRPLPDADGSGDEESGDEEQDDEERPETEVGLGAVEVRFEDHVAPVERLGVGAGGVSAVGVCAGEHVTLGFDVTPWPHDQSNVEAILLDVREDVGDRALLTREAWTRLEEHAGPDSSWYSPPLLTLERGNHTMTVWTPPSAGGRSVLLMAACFDDERTSVRPALVRIDIRQAPCRFE